MSNEGSNGDFKPYVPPRSAPPGGEGQQGVPPQYPSAQPSGEQTQQSPTLYSPHPYSTPPAAPPYSAPPQQPYSAPPPPYSAPPPQSAPPPHSAPGMSPQAYGQPYGAPYGAQPVPPGYPGSQPGPQPVAYGQTPANPYGQPAPLPYVQPMSAGPADPYGQGQPHWPQPPFPPVHVVQDDDEDDDEDEDDEDDEPRRQWLPWAVGVVALVVLALVASVLLAPSKKDEADKPRGVELDKGSVTARWSADGKVIALAYTVVGDVLVGLECGTDFDPVDGPDQCTLRGRDARSGTQRWVLPEGAYGQTLLTVGSAAVLFGDDEAVVVNQAGNLVKRVPQGELLGYTDAVAVFYSRNPDGTARLVGVDVATGAEVWQDASEPAWADEFDQRNYLRAVAVPDGFGAHYAPEPTAGRYVAVPVVVGGERAMAVRDVATGAQVATSTADDKVDGVLGENVLRTLTKGGRSEVRLTAASTPGRAQWNVSLRDGESARVCGGLVCVFDADAESSRLLEPAKGAVLAKGTGYLLARSAGDNAAIVQCGAVKSVDDPCPLANATLKVVHTTSAKVLYTGQVPAFVATVKSGLLVGVGKANQAKSTLLYFKDERGVSLGEVDGVPPTVDAKKEFGDVATVPDAITGDVRVVPGVACAASDAALACAPSWKRGTAKAWRFATG